MLWLGYIAVTLAVATQKAYSLQNAEGTAKITDFVPANWADLTTDQLIAEGEAGGLFTSWMSKDNSAESGTGDFEGAAKLLSKNVGNCDMWCAEPVLVQWRLVDRSDPDMVSRIDNCLYLEPHKFSLVKYMTYPGYNCIDGYQYKGPCDATECAAIGMRKGSKRSNYDCDYCPNAEVRYMCPEARDMNAPCPTSLTTRDLDDEMALLDAQIEKRELEMAELQSQATIMQKKELTAEVETEITTDKLQQLIRELLATVDEKAP